MRYRVCAVLGLLFVAASEVGCASSLDFDGISSGVARHATDAGSHATDAGTTDPTPRIDAVPASDPPAPSDAGALATSRPDAHAAPVATGTFANAGAGSAASAPAPDAGSSDAAVAADPVEFSCAKLTPKPYFCDDFESLDLSGHWSEVNVYPTDPLPAGSIEIDSNAARAGQSSLLAQVYEGVRVCDNCIQVRAGLTLPNLQGPIKLTAELDLRVEQIDPTEGRRAMLFQVWWGTPELGFTEQTVQLWSSEGTAWTGLVEIETDPLPADGSSPQQIITEHQWQQTPVLSEWVHVVYALDVQDAAGTASVARLTVGDVVLFDGPLSSALRQAKAELEIGVPWVDMQMFGPHETTLPWRIRYDNVFVRYEQR